MKNKALILISLILISCGNSNKVSSSSSSVLSKESFTSSSNETTSLSESKDISSISSESESSSANEENTPKSRHDFYLEYSKLDKWYYIPFQGKLIGYEQYQYSPNCNAWFQEEKYGYYMINLPLELVEIGKSYQLYGNACERSYYGVNAKSDAFYCIECGDIEVEEINLNNETPINDDYIGSSVIFDGVIESINDNIMKVNINQTLYEVNYNKDVISALEISTIWTNYKVGDAIRGKGILHTSNREIRMINVSDFK